MVLISYMSVYISGVLGRHGHFDVLTVRFATALAIGIVSTSMPSFGRGVEHVIEEPRMEMI